MNLYDIQMKTYFLKTAISILCTCYIVFRVTNNKEKVNYKDSIIITVLTLISSFFVTLAKVKTNSLVCIALIVSISDFICFEFINDNIIKSTIAVIISLSINYIFFFLGICITYVINKIYIVKNDYMNLLVITAVQLVGIICTLKIKRIKKGFSFLNKTTNDYWDIIILNICACLLFSVIIFFIFVILK